MHAGRRDETPRTWFRSDAVFSCNGRWYFHTREGIDIGPYDSQTEAEIESGMLRALIKRSAMGGESLGVLREFILESFTMGRPLNVMISEDIEHTTLHTPAR